MRYVFIGGPSTGKTTVIEHMRAMGFLTLPETARRLLEDSSVVKPSLNRDSFQREVFRQQLLAEEKEIGDGSAPCFLDGGVFDGCAYYLCDGLNVPAIYDTMVPGMHGLFYLRNWTILSPTACAIRMRLLLIVLLRILKVAISPVLSR